MSSIAASEIEKILRESFGFYEFRQGQRELIEAVLAGRDALGVLPTGGGKSLTYQLPAVLLEGLTLVVSPLIALMKDQVDAFNRRGGRRAVAIHSNQTSAETRDAVARAENGKAALLYVAPERFEFAGFREKILALKPRLFVVDEAHCVNQWGFDFRPSYLALAGMAQALRPAPILALTATATPSTRNEIIGRLGLSRPLICVAPFDRPNLRFEVHDCSPNEKMRRLLRILKESYDSGSHIVYVGRRKDADDIAAQLNAERLGAVPYHAGMNGDDRRRAQESWLSGKKPITVATVAFGMGIDKPDVRTVAHYQHPSSLEAYYQEAGRAGRDGAPARCITLFSSKDVALSHFFLRNRYPSPEDVHQLLTLVSPQGTTLEGIRNVLGTLSDEQINMALWVLQEQGKVWRDEEGLLKRKEMRFPTHLSLGALFARKRADYKRLEEVLAYCEDFTCHRRHLLRYFGEKVDIDFRCGNCSACSGGTARLGAEAAEDEAARILQLNREALESSGPLNAKTLAQFFAGSHGKRIPQEWHKLRGYGAFQGTPASQLQNLAARALVRPAEIPETGGQLRLKRVEPTAVKAVPEPVMIAPHYRPTPSLEAMKERKVERKSGLAILGLLQESGIGLPPVGLAHALIGAARSDFVLENPALQSLKHFGAERGRDFVDVLFDILAMKAKGFLIESAGHPGRLGLHDSGKAVLKSKTQGHSRTGPD